MKKYFVILFVLISTLAWSQEKSVNKHFDQQLDYAKELVYSQDYKNAYINLLDIYQLDSSNQELNYYLGYASFYANRDKNIALPYLTKGAQFNGNAYYFMGYIYQQNKKFNLARAAYNNYKSVVFEDKLIANSEVNRQINKIKTAQKIFKNKLQLKVLNLGPEINSAYPDYAPVLFANGNKLYFTSRRKGSFPEFKDPNNEYFEDVYLSEKINDTWQAPINIGAPINTKTHDASVAMSNNDSVFYIYRTNSSLVGGDILKATKNGDNWNEPTIFESTINSKMSSESSISIHPSGKMIFFSSNRPGGYGGKDIYYVKLLPNGKWSLPSNLGGIINTEEDEDGPFISSDGTTLYFSSKGHENMGGYDLFKSHLKDNKQWSEPENMGYPINSVMDDIFISTVDNQEFFFSSNRAGGYGFSDIYHTFLPQKKNEYIVIKGRVIDDKNKLSLAAHITVFNEFNNKLEGTYKSDKASGKFIMILKPDEKYKMFIEAKGFYNQTLEIDLTQNLSIEDVLKTIPMTPKHLSVEHE